MSVEVQLEDEQAGSESGESGRGVGKRRVGEAIGPGFTAKDAAEAIQRLGKTVRRTILGKEQSITADHNGATPE